MLVFVVPLEARPAVSDGEVGEAGCTLLSSTELRMVVPIALVDRPAMLDDAVIEVGSTLLSGTMLLTLVLIKSVGRGLDVSGDGLAVAGDTGG